MQRFRSRPQRHYGLLRHGDPLKQVSNFAMCKLSGTLTEKYFISDFLAAIMIQLRYMVSKSLPLSAYVIWIIVRICIITSINQTKIRGCLWNISH